MTRCDNQNNGHNTRKVDKIGNKTMHKIGNNGTKIMSQTSTNKAGLVQPLELFELVFATMNRWDLSKCQQAHQAL